MEDYGNKVLFSTCMLLLKPIKPDMNQEVYWILQIEYYIQL